MLIQFREQQTEKRLSVTMASWNLRLAALTNITHHVIHPYLLSHSCMILNEVKTTCKMQSYHIYDPFHEKTNIVDSP